MNGATTCKSWMKYSWEGIACEEPSWEGDPEGLCILHSLKMEKDKNAFDQAKESKLAREDYDFREVIFPGPVSFARQKFNKPVNFSRAKFSGWADFRDAEFAAGADYSYAKFAQTAIFTKARFFHQAIFQGLEIVGEADFRGINLDAWVIFQQINESKGISGALPFTAVFQQINFGSKGEILFRDVSLAKVSFLGTDMRRLKFHNVSWHLLRGRQAVYDEILLENTNVSTIVSLTQISENTHDYERLCARVGELYRYLKLNYEHEGDLKQAGDFHYGEMEMHRRANVWRRRFPLSWYNLYRVLSGYGERPLRALGWLLGLVVGLSIVLQWSGLKTAEGNNASFGEAVIFVMEQATLIRPLWPQPITSAGHMLAAISHFLIPGQAALFLLAIRNRLGRRH